MRAIAHRRIPLEPRTFTPLLVADWTDAMFVHFAVNPAALRPFVPAALELELYGSNAFISLVAFTQRHLRPCLGGRLTAFLSRPLAEHHFLNVRTYVRHAGEPGIYFLAEWIPNRLACVLGPLLYGLPYRLGTLDYRRDQEQFEAVVRSRCQRLRFAASFGQSDRPCVAQPGTLDEFLVERYTAFTVRGSALYRFQIEHESWELRRAKVKMSETNLLADIGDLLSAPIAAHCSEGLHDVHISAPLRVRTMSG